MIKWGGYMLKSRKSCFKMKLPHADVIWSLVVVSVFHWSWLDEFLLFSCSEFSEGQFFTYGVLIDRNNKSLSIKTQKGLNVFLRNNRVTKGWHLEYMKYVFFFFKFIRLIQSFSAYFEWISLYGIFEVCFFFSFCTV